MIPIILAALMAATPLYAKPFIAVSADTDETNGKLYVFYDDGTVSEIEDDYGAKQQIDTLIILSHWVPKPPPPKYWLSPDYTVWVVRK